MKTKTTTIFSAPEIFLAFVRALPEGTPAKLVVSTEGEGLQLIAAGRMIFISDAEVAGQLPGRLGEQAARDLSAFLQKGANQNG